MENKEETAQIAEVKKSTCCFCNSSKDNELIYGKLYEKDGIVAHHHCLFLSPLLVQKKKVSEGFLGFLTEDIKTEINRGSDLRCVYCKKTGATIGCSISKCKRLFHYPCGLERNCMHEFFDEYRSYCRDHRPKQIVDDKILEELLNIPIVICVICKDAVDPLDNFNALWAPCCKNSSGFFHRTCVQQLAMKDAGYFFKCPLCQNKDIFRNEMLDNGIYIPKDDESWEMNSDKSNVSTRYRCCAKKCLCPKGRNHKKDVNSKWRLLLCRTCGSRSIHLRCSGLKEANLVWNCSKCYFGTAKSTSKIREDKKKKSTPKAKHSKIKKNIDECLQLKKLDTNFLNQQTLNSVIKSDLQDPQLPSGSMTNENNRDTSVEREESNLSSEIEIKKKFLNGLGLKKTELLIDLTEGNENVPEEILGKKRAKVNDDSIVPAKYSKQDDKCIKNSATKSEFNNLSLEYHIKETNSLFREHIRLTQQQNDTFCKIIENNESRTEGAQITTIIESFGRLMQQYFERSEERFEQYRIQSDARFDRLIKTFQKSLNSNTTSRLVQMDKHYDDLKRNVNSLSSKLGLALEGMQFQSQMINSLITGNRLPDSPSHQCLPSKPVCSTSHSARNSNVVVVGRNSEISLSEFKDNTNYHQTSRMSFDHNNGHQNQTEEGICKTLIGTMMSPSSSALSGQVQKEQRESGDSANEMSASEELIVVTDDENDL